MTQQAMPVFPAWICLLQIIFYHRLRDECTD